MIFIPDTEFKKLFGLDLRITMIADPNHKSSMVIAHQGPYSDHSYSFFLDETPLYEFQHIESPPHQLKSLKKPVLRDIEKPLAKTNFLVNLNTQATISVIPNATLDRFVADMNKDPLAIAQYIYNEIDLSDPFVNRSADVFYAPLIHRSPYAIFLEKRGSQWEQCYLLVDLLRRAGYQAVFAQGKANIPSSFMEKLLFVPLPGENEVTVNYPWVNFFDGQQWITLFPWMKEIHVDEGYDLYHLLPDKYASADRWIMQYLTNDEQILKHIGPDNDNTAGVLFVRFVEEELRKQGLSINDVGIHRTICKKQYVSWDDFPRPKLEGTFHFVENILEQQSLFAQIRFEIASQENPSKKISSDWFNIQNYNGRPVGIHFSLCKDGTHLMHV